MRRTSPGLGQALRIALLALLCWLAPAVAAEPAAPAPLQLSAETQTLDLWPAVTVRHDAAGTLTLPQVLASRHGFEPPGGSTSSLGLADGGAVWLRAGWVTAPDTAGDWIIDIDYAPLQRIDMVLLRDGRPLRSVTRGSLQPRQAYQGRTSALMERLEGGSAYELVLRVQTQGALILPIRISRPAAFHAMEQAEQMLQGLLLGLGACLVFYSLIQWLVVREALFGKYALLAGGSVLFSAAHFGVGAQFLWPGSLWLEAHAGGLASLLATIGSFLFIGEALDRGHGRWWLRGVMNAGAVLALILTLLFAVDLLEPPALAATQSVLALVPVLLGIPVATRRALAGDRIGATFLVAWLIYLASTAVIIGVIQGLMPVNSWTMHAFQFGATLDMLLFMHVLGLRMKHAHHEARLARHERDAMYSLAHTDPLTGLLNRRGLDAALARHLPQVGQERMLAVYVLDLDGFKAVNDRHGHQVGDQLLVFAGQRLRHCLRESDLVARPGGDEFVVVAAELSDERQAEDIGLQMLHRFERSFKLHDLRCDVGVTIGYAVGPEDGVDADTLFGRADTALFKGKQAGKNVLVRAPGAMPAVPAAVGQVADATN